jgi:hypothetical protein
VIETREYLTWIYQNLFKTKELRIKMLSFKEEKEKRKREKEE